MTLIEHCWPFDSSTDHFTLLIKAALCCLVDKSSYVLNATRNTVHDIIEPGRVLMGEPGLHLFHFHAETGGEENII